MKYSEKILFEHPSGTKVRLSKREKDFAEERLGTWIIEIKSSEEGSIFGMVGEYYQEEDPYMEDFGKICGALDYVKVEKLKGKIPSIFQD